MSWKAEGFYHTFFQRTHEPAAQLALVIEAAPEDGVPAQIIRDVAYKPLAEVVKLPIVAKHLGPLLERHRRSIEILRERIEARDGVIFFDVSDLDLEGYNKFVPYLLYPECVYSISVSASAVRAKVSLGTNPWNLATANQNLASLAEKIIEPISQCIEPGIIGTDNACFDAVGESGTA